MIIEKKLILAMATRPLGQPDSYAFAAKLSDREEYQYGFWCLPGATDEEVKNSVLAMAESVLLPAVLKQMGRYDATEARQEAEQA